MNILAIGDSYAAGVGGTPNWLDILEVPENLRQAIPGSTAKSWENNTEGILDYAIGSTSDVNTVIISLLGNDAMKGIKDGSISAKELLDSIDSMNLIIHEITAELSKVLIFLYADPTFGKDEYTAKSVDLINRALIIVANFCDQYATVSLVDLRQVLTKGCFDKGNVHPNAKGQAKIAAAIKRLL